MRRIVKVLICAVMVLGIGGCGSSKKIDDPKELYEKFKEEGYTFKDKDYTYSSFKHTSISNGSITIKDSYDPDSENPHSITIVNDLNSDMSIMTVGKVEKEDYGKSVNILLNKDCLITFTSSEETEGDSCSEKALSDAKDFKETALSALDDLNIDIEFLYEFFEWYVNQ